MKTAFLIIPILAILSCNSKPQKQAIQQVATIDPKLLVNCDGIGEIHSNDTYADLKKRFGNAVTDHENNRNGNFTIVWESTPKQINIYWNESKPPYKTIKYLETTDVMAPYMTADSIGVGISLRDLVKKNGYLAITFTNFYASVNPGVIKDFTTGEIPKKHPCFSGSFESTDQRPIDVKEFKKFQTINEVKSYDQILGRIDVVLSSIRITPKR